MNLMNDSALDRILNNAWRAYRNVQAAIDAIESVGLEINGDYMGQSGAPAVFGALTAAGAAMMAALGVPDEAPWSDQAYDLLAGATEQERAEKAMPARIRQEFARLAQDAFRRSAPAAPEGARPYEVTLALSGGIQVDAADAAGAMEIVNKMPVERLVAAAYWSDDGPAPTDAYEAE